MCMPSAPQLYVELRRQFPTARAIGYIPPRIAWRIAAFSLTGQLDAYLAAISQVAAAYDEFLDFSIPSALTQARRGPMTVRIICGRSTPACWPA